jgi:Glycosyl transferases group 1
MHLILAGTGPREAELKAAAPPEVTFLGFLDRQTRLPNLYANCDAFVFSSLTETLGCAMVMLAGEYELTRRLARAARRTAESLSWERELDRLDASYREICGRGVAPDRGLPAPEVCSA